MASCLEELVKLGYLTKAQHKISYFSFVKLRIPKVSAKIMATGELLESQKIVQHKTFSRSSDGKGSPNDDIALIFLKNSINPQSNASVICVPAEGQKFDDKDCLSSAVIDPKGNLIIYQANIFLNMVNNVDLEG